MKHFSGIVHCDDGFRLSAISGVDSWNDGTVSLVCDARLDNRAELTRLLTDGDAAPHEVTDPELIARAYARWGTSCPQRLVGDFAFAAWDQSHRRLFCARDPIGVRPFYYYADARRFCWASTLKTLLAMPDVPRRVDESMMADYLMADFLDPEATFFESIRQLRPAHLLCVEQSRQRPLRYWHPETHAVTACRRDEEYLEHFRELFREAVRCRLQSRSPVGVMLSGGIDSTSVTAMAQTLRRDDATAPSLFAVTVCSDILQDEWDAIQRLRTTFEIPVHFLHPDTGNGHPMAPFEWFLSRTETPYFHGFHVHPRIFETVVSSGGRVMLTGIGADELLGAGMGEDGTLLSVLKRRVPPQVRWAMRTARGRRVPRWIAPDFAARQRLASRLPAPEEQTFPARCQEASFRALTARALVLGLNQLHEAASASAVEYRHPFLDRRLIEFVLALPPDIKLRGGHQKWLLQRALEGIVPGPLREQWHGTLVASTRIDDRDTRIMEARRIEELLGPRTAPIFRYVEADRIAHLLREEFVKQGRLGLRTPLWKIVSVAQWLHGSCG